jgi:transcriptional regulator PpsR
VTAHPTNAAVALKNFTKAIGTIDAESAAALVTLSTDIAVMVDQKGIVRDFSIGDESLSREADIAGWVGHPWIDTVTVESRPKIEQLLKDASGRKGSRWRQVNHRMPNGTADLPVRYAAIKIGHGGQIVALGRELRAMSLLQQKLVDAQQAMEREYARVRAAETRYRLLFQLSSEPVVILDAASLRVVDANPAAVRILGPSSRKVTGRQFADLLSDGSIPVFQALVAAVRSSGKAEPVQISLAKDDKIYTLSASSFRQDTISHLLIRLATTRTAPAVTVKAQVQADLRSLVDRIPDAFALIADDQSILMVNSAFLDLAQLASREMTDGQSLERWIGRSPIDLNAFMKSLREHGSARRFNTIVRGELGLIEDVEISAVAVPDGAYRCRRARRSGPTAVGQAAHRAGRTSPTEEPRPRDDGPDRAAVYRGGSGNRWRQSGHGG